jgi:hypothetical protein
VGAQRRKERGGERDGEEQNKITLNKIENKISKMTGISKFAKF